jgi:O-antigen ligase
LFILGVLGYLSYTLAPMPVKQRYEKETVSSGFKTRIECWKIGVVEILEAPILGVGLSNSGLLADPIRAIALSKYGINISATLATDWVPYAYYMPVGIRDIHNIYLEVCAEGGLITLAIFIWFIVSIAKMLFKSLRMVPMYSELWQMGLGLLASFVFVLFIGMSEPVLNRKIFWSIFGLIIAFYRIVTENKQNKYKEEQL